MTRWYCLFGALILLLPPIPFSAAVQKSLSSLRRNSRANAAATARVWQNWADLIRAALGVWLLNQFSFIPNKNDPTTAELLTLGLKASILGVALLIQTVRLIRTVQFVAPIFYMCGLTLTLGGEFWLPFKEGYLQGLFAVAVGWAFAIGGKNLAYQLPAMAIALGVAGYVLSWGIPLILNCALIVLPFVVSLLFRKQLLYAARIPSST